MRKTHITLSDSGFAIVTPKGIDQILIEEVNEIVAYKIDEITTDLICCDIVTGDVNGALIRTVHEDIPGFDELMEHLKALPGFKRDWYSVIVLPPFDRNRTVIFERKATAG